MQIVNLMYIKELTIEHRKQPIGIDCASPRICWKLDSRRENTFQSAYRIRIYRMDGAMREEMTICDTGKVMSDSSIEVTVPDFAVEPMTAYFVEVTVWDNYDRSAQAVTTFESGRMGVPFASSWTEPVCPEGDRAVHYIRIPVRVSKAIKKARIYACAHGVYQLYVNGRLPDDRLLAPENTPYNEFLYYQTYDITPLLHKGENMVGVMLGDGWWRGNVGFTGAGLQYGEKLGLLLDGTVEYMDGTVGSFRAEDGISSTGAALFSDLFIGEHYDARLEMPGWNTTDFDDSAWTPVEKVEYHHELTGQILEPVRAVTTLKPKKIIRTPKGETVLDVGQVVAGVVEFTLQAEAGQKIVLEHSEILGQDGNYYDNIQRKNKDQIDWYITKDGAQTYRPSFTFHGFRYVKISGWPGEMTQDQFTVYVFATDMRAIGSFTTDNELINQLQSNILWSQTANTISIPTDCPQREKAGWTGDIMAFAPTLCCNLSAESFLESWMKGVRMQQFPDGKIPMIVPYLKDQREFFGKVFGTDTSCGWGDAVLRIPLSAYLAYGDRRIIEENYDAMKGWLSYIENRAKNCHPDNYEEFTQEEKERDCYLWSTDFHFGDWLVPSMVLGNPDSGAMRQTAYATMGYIAPAYFAFSASLMAEIAGIMGNEADETYYKDLYEKIRAAYIAQYVHEDGSLDAPFQGVYVVTLQMGLVTDEIRPKMVQKLCDMIHANGDRLDTGFLSIPFLMDVLCDNGRSDVAYQLLFQTGCPSWLYEIIKDATTIWESWGAIGEDGTVGTYSYNHYAFGCVGEWMYRYLGGISAAEPGYKKIRIEPHFAVDLNYISVCRETPYGQAEVSWRKIGQSIAVQIQVPVNTTAQIILPGCEACEVGSGSYSFLI